MEAMSIRTTVGASVGIAFGEVGMITDAQRNQPSSDAESPVSGLSVVVPVYGSEAILPELVRRLGDVLIKIASRYELILVNDCSPDHSWDVIGQLQQQYSWLHGINLMRNYGQHNALL